MRIGTFPYSPGFNPYQRLFAEALESAGLSVIRIPNRRWFPIHFALSHPIDLLHMDWPHSFYTARSALATRIKRVMYFRGLRRLRDFPLVWTAHNIIAHDAPDAAEEIVMIQRLIDCCDGVTVMSAAAGKILRQTYRIPGRTRLEVIPHGHYIDAYPNTVTRSQAREELQIPPDAKVVLFLGRILPYKGVDDLIEAFAQVGRAGDVLLVAGPAGQQEFVSRLQALARDRCPAGARIGIAAEVIADDQVQIYFNACDAVALPFRAVLNSGSLMLAMSFGRCVVAPRRGSLSEVACEEACFGYDPDQPGALADALRNTLQQGDLLRRGSAAREFVRQRCDWKTIGRKARRLYEQILAGR